MNNMVLVIDENSLTGINLKATEYMSAAKSVNTLTAYRKDWQDFEQFCVLAGLNSLPAAADTVVSYLTVLADTHKVSTLERRIASISQAHQAADLNSPTSDMKVRILMQGIRREKGTAQDCKAPAVTSDIKAMVSTLPDSLLGIRDRALLLVGFAGGFRRSELVALDVEDLEFKREGLVINLRRSKTDQEGQGRKVAIPYGSNCDTCPVRSLQLWLEASGISSGPVFRSVNRHGNLQANRLSDKAVALVVKRTAEAAGLDSSKYSGHSLRAGMATSAAAAGVSERAIMNQTGHRSQSMVRRYIREGNLFNDNAAARLGL
ncbi:site-specific integrase [Syntrophomonas wolfei]|uniref:site-specific integrase n=1 Tax=Syntrophomonas wolfei TaxID=863 RepID=UPI0023F32E86|nr:site-specific integrase [Syntrophomonas wolfei]